MIPKNGPLSPETYETTGFPRFKEVVVKSFFSFFDNISEWNLQFINPYFLP